MLAKREVDRFLALFAITGKTPASVEELFALLEKEHVAVTIDHREEPEEAWSSLESLVGWQSVARSETPKSAEELIAIAAVHQHGLGARLLNLDPGSDSWLVIAVPKDRVSAVVGAAANAGLPRPEPV
jgi:hypothetical protein